jgi:hypothetical protein
MNNDQKIHLDYKIADYIELNIFQINFLLKMANDAKDTIHIDTSWFAGLLNEINILAKTNIVIKQHIYSDSKYKSFSKIIVLNEKKMLMILKALQHNYSLNNIVFNDIINFEMTESLISWKIQLLNEQNNLWPMTTKQPLKQIAGQAQMLRL